MAVYAALRDNPAQLIRVLENVAAETKACSKMLQIAQSIFNPANNCLI
jgi:hypothetical protein